AATYALPAEWRRRFGLRRYGFHGLSYSYAVRRTGEMLGGVPARTVVCHLGAGASLCAVADGRSVDTTMGFTPLEGLVMASRAGSIDPGIPLWLIRQGLPVRDVDSALENDSGLRGLAGTGDMRKIRALAAERDADALAALDVYHHRLRACAAAMTASLGGLDALVFTGGVGEHDAAVRLRLAEDLAYLGVSVDGDRNAGVDGDADITAPDAAVRTLVIESREDREIAAGTRRVLSGGSDRKSSWTSVRSGLPARAHHVEGEPPVVPGDLLPAERPLGREPGGHAGAHHDDRAGRLQRDRRREDPGLHPLHDDTVEQPLLATALGEVPAADRLFPLAALARAL